MCASVMKIRPPTRICLVPNVSGVGGMVSFANKLSAGMAVRGLHVCRDLADLPYDAVLVIGGTRQLAGLWRARRRGVRIVQRLDGMNWLHRQRSRRTGWYHFLRAEYGNALLAFIRSRLADQVVYQSNFARSWWEQAHGPTRVPNCVVYNGVDLQAYSPGEPHLRPLDRCRLLMVEGSLMGGYELGLEAGVGLAQALASARLDVELLVIGRVTDKVRSRWGKLARVTVQWAGEVPSERIPEYDRSAHLLYSSDIHPACPNSVIEALACGLPVVAFDTGALPELVQGDAGRVVPYGSDPWRLERPDVRTLAGAALEILDAQEHFRQAARRRAEDAFSLDQMVEGYLTALLE
jgi:glycosyltransferase involved in cell wall biosynthesis